jgi:hypothetical protein
MTVLILGSADDDHAAHVLHYLKTNGTDAEFLNSSRFPAELQIAVTCLGEPRASARGWTKGKSSTIPGLTPGARQEQSFASGTIRLPGGRRLGFDEISAVYWRCYHGVPTPPLPDAEQAYIAQNDARSLFESLLIALPARWVNGWQAYQLHQTKPVQLAMVAALGVPLPATLLGNDPAAVRKFVAGHPQCIFKPVQGGAHTQRVEPRHLSDENLKNLAVAPVTIQEEVPGTDIRVFVAGDRVLACEVQTGELDFRNDPDPRIVPTELPPAVAEQCRQIARTLHLLWTGIDLRRTPEGQFIFLEANPSPMFLGFEQRSGLPLTESLVRVLMGNDPLLVPM